MLKDPRTRSCYKILKAVDNTAIHVTNTQQQPKVQGLASRLNLNRYRALYYKFNYIY